ncbi:rod-binding protein, partial [Bordetella petrii]|uniref:rod-binding protein n=1 Tax=Bordetella petrii TaxID=94624 RepID=UPI001E6060C7
MAFVSYTPRPGSQQSVFDLGRLADLKRDAKAQPGDSGNQKEVATQVEALFLQMMLKRMREASPKSGLFDSEQSQMLRSMADEQLALQLANPGVGLAQSMLQQMQQGRPAGVPDAALDGALQATVPAQASRAGN